MAIETNMRLNYRFAIDIEGIDQYYIQELTLPDRELGEVMHGGLVNEPDSKTPGKQKIGDMVAKKCAPVAGPDNFASTWMELARLGRAESYRRNITVREIGEDGFSTVAVYEMIGVWPKKIGGRQYKREGDGELILEEVTFSVKDFKQVL